jgi:branched-chain amino acid transport system substrate-binding protein
VPLQRAAQLAVDEINKKGGIKGEQIQVIWENGQCKTDVSKKAAENLINKQKVQFILGGVCSVETLAAAPIAEQNRVIMISPASTTPEISQAGNYIFRLAASDALIGKVVSKIASEKFKLKKAAVIFEDTAYIKGIEKSFIESYKALGGEIVYEKSYATGDRNSAQLAINALATKPEVIYLLPESPTQGLQQIERLKKSKEPLVIIVDEVMLSRQFIQENAEKFEGVYGLEGYFNPEADRTKNFLTQYKNQFAEEAEYPYYMSNMYDSVYLLKDSIEKFNTDTVSIQKYLTGIKAWPGASGDITFDENGDVLTKFSLLKIVGGKAELVEIVDSALK